MAGGGTNTVQQTLPSWLQPYLSGELSTANQITPGINQGMPASSLVATQTPLQQQGISALTGAASQGANEAGSAAAANQFETSGALLNPNENPYLQNTFNLASQSVQNNLDSQFAGSGSNVQNSLPVQSDEMNNLATQLYGGAYQQGVNTMTQAAGMSPIIQQGLYTPGQELYGAGTTQQQQQQNLINAPYNALSWYSGLLGLNGSSLGGSSATSGGNAALQDAGAGIGALGAIAEIAPYFASA